MDLTLWARKCSEVLVRGSCKHFAVTASKGPCVLAGLVGLSVCVCVCACVCVWVNIYIYLESYMDLSPWARKWIEYLVRGICNNFVVTGDKGPCVVNGLAGLSMCVCVCIYIFVCVCVYIYKVTCTGCLGRAIESIVSCVVVALISL
jgi:multisubunit Na+/H+ antiporter MnhF subunit